MVHDSSTDKTNRSCTVLGSSEVEKWCFSSYPERKEQSDSVKDKGTTRQKYANKLLNKSVNVCLVKLKHPGFIVL